MATGKCVMYKDGKPYAVRVDFDGTSETDMDIPDYEYKGIQPPWEDLDPCPGTGGQRFPS